MHNCIFTAHCTEAICDKSCPILVETSYLLERNGLNFSNPVFSTPVEKVRKMMKLLELADGKLGVYKIEPDETTVQSSDLITYCAICKYWKGSRLHCNVYNLKFSKYIDEIKKTWNGTPESEQYQYMKIWAESAKVLIVSNFDYVDFTDYVSQTMLNLIQQRQSQGLTTILVSPQIGMLVSAKKSSFFDILAKIMSANIIKLPSGSEMGGGRT